MSGQLLTLVQSLLADLPPLALVDTLSHMAPLVLTLLFGDVSKAGAAGAALREKAIALLTEGVAHEPVRAALTSSAVEHVVTSSGVGRDRALTPLLDLATAVLTRWLPPAAEQLGIEGEAEAAVEWAHELVSPLCQETLLADDVLVQCMVVQFWRRLVVLVAERSQTSGLEYVRQHYRFTSPIAGAQDALQWLQTKLAAPSDVVGEMLLGEVLALFGATTSHDYALVAADGIPQRLNTMLRQSSTATGQLSPTALDGVIATLAKLLRHDMAILPLLPRLQLRSPSRFQILASVVHNASLAPAISASASENTTEYSGTDVEVEDAARRESQSLNAWELKSPPDAILRLLEHASSHFPRERSAGRSLLSVILSFGWGRRRVLGEDALMEALLRDNGPSAEHADVVGRFELCKLLLDGLAKDAALANGHAVQTPTAAAAARFEPRLRAWVDAGAYGRTIDDEVVVAMETS